MNISLRKITEENWRECINLKVKGDQQKFVASNENALALAYVYPEMNPRAIYNDEIMVGFLMYAIDLDDGIHYINRLMIDEKFQGNGYGKKALELLVRQLKSENVKVIDIIHKPDNLSAIKIYNSLGFNLIELKVENDVVSRLEF